MVKRMLLAIVVGLFFVCSAKAHCIPEHLGDPLFEVYCEVITDQYSADAQFGTAGSSIGDGSSGNKYVEVWAYQGSNTNNQAVDQWAYSWVTIRTGIRWLGEQPSFAGWWEYSFEADSDTWAAGSQWGNGSIKVEGKAYDIVSGFSSYIETQAYGHADKHGPSADADFLSDLDYGMRTIADAHADCSASQGWYSSTLDTDFLSNGETTRMYAGWTEAYVELTIYTQSYLNDSGKYGLSPEWSNNAQGDVRVDWNMQFRWD